MKRKLTKRLTTLLTVIALLLLILPAGVLFADSIADNGKKPDKTTIQTDLPDVEKPDEEESEEETDADEPSEQAAIVAERIATAEILGITPGHLNLIDKLAAISGSTRDELLAELELSDWKDASVQNIMLAIKRCRFREKGKELPGSQQDEEVVTAPAAGNTEPEAETDSTETKVKSNNGRGQAKGKKQT